MNRTKRKWITVAALFSLAAAQTASAENIWCRGPLSGLYVTDTGDVIIHGAWRSDWTRICNNQGNDGSDTVTCTTWMSLAATATKDALELQLMYSVPSGTTCNTLATYSGSPGPLYVMLLPRP